MLLLLLSIQITKATSFNLNNNACGHLYNYPVKATSSDCFVNPNVMALTPDMIRQNGYPLLSYNVTTPDDYILQLFRIPPKEDDYRKNKQPVLLEHGLFHDSSTWTFVGNRSLAFTLADRGYDVWLGNDRGTRYSRTHTKLKSTDFAYWTFSMDTMAANDIPTFLNTIADETGKAGSIIYIGHSRGNTLAFMYASENPEEAQKLLKGIIAICPLVYLDLVWYLKPVYLSYPLLGNFLLSQNKSALLYNLDDIYSFLENFCALLPYVCRYILDVSTGKTWQFMPEDLLSFYTHFPSSEAVRILIQFGQMVKSKKFQKYDYGKQDNLEKYGQEDPPLYHLDKITLPVYMFYGKNDVFIKEEVVKKIFDELGSVNKEFWSVPIGVNKSRDQFDHNDFIWAKYLETYFYEDLFAILDTQFQSN